MVKESKIIFHSDGGGQYYDKQFLHLTGEYNFKNSMCEYAYENGKAERINGIIKNNYLEHRGIKDLESLIKEVDRAVKLYNEDRPHKKKLLSLREQNQSKAKESIDEKQKNVLGIHPRCS